MRLDFSSFYIKSKVMASDMFSGRSSEWAERGSTSIGQEVRKALENK